MSRSQCHRPPDHFETKKEGEEDGDRDAGVLWCSGRESRENQSRPVGCKLLVNHDQSSDSHTLSTIYPQSNVVMMLVVLG